MKLIQTLRVSAWASLAMVVAQLLAASTSNAAGYKLADKTGASIAEFRDEILNISKQVDVTVAALDKVVQTAATDPRPAFKEFQKSVPRIDDAAEKAKKRANEMKARGQAYFKDWEKELAGVSNPEIRKLAEERRAKLLAAFDSIKGFMEPTRDEFNSWLGDLKDLEKYLNNDLTIAGVDAAKTQIAKARTEGQAVQQSLGNVIAELNTIVATLTPASAKKQ